MVYTLTQRRRWLQLDHSTKSRTKRNHQSTMMFVFLVFVTIAIFLSPVRTSATGTTRSSAETIKLESDTTPLWNSHEFIQDHRSRNADAQLNTLPSSSSSSSSSSSVPSTPTTQTTTTTTTTKERSARQRRQLLDEMYYVRRRTQQQQRQLPGNEMMGDIDLMSAEAGFMVGFSFLIILLFLCVCCCCCRRRPYGGGGGGGGGSNCLWDLVAIVCLWEMCCDNDGIMGDGFMRF